MRGPACREQIPPSGPGLESLLLTRNFAGPPCTILSPRSLLVRCGGFEAELQGTEDWDMWARLVFAGCDVVSIRRVGAYYRLHQNSWSRNSVRMSIQYARYHERVLASIMALPKAVAKLGRDQKELASEVRRQYAAALCEVAYQSREVGHYWSALSYYLAGLRRGQFSAFVAIFKLIPHRLLRLLRRAPLNNRLPFSR